MAKKVRVDVDDIPVYEYVHFADVVVVQGAKHSISGLFGMTESRGAWWYHPMVMQSRTTTRGLLAEQWPR